MFSRRGVIWQNLIIGKTDLYVYDPTKLTEIPSSFYKNLMQRLGGYRDLVMHEAKFNDGKEK